MSVTFYPSRGAIMAQASIFVLGVVLLPVIFGGLNQLPDLPSVDEVGVQSLALDVIYRVGWVLCVWLSLTLIRHTMARSLVTADESGLQVLPMKLLPRRTDIPWHEVASITSAPRGNVRITRTTGSRVTLVAHFLRTEAGDAMSVSDVIDTLSRARRRP